MVLWIAFAAGALVFAAAWGVRRLRAVYRPFAPIFTGPDLESQLPHSPQTRGIAHNGGDTQEGLALVNEHAVDVVEIDVALVNGRLDVAHTPPRRIPRWLVPLVYKSASLDDAWKELPEGIDVYLDLKSRGKRAVEQVAQVLEAHKERVMFVGSPDLEALTELRSLVPGAQTIFYPKTRQRLEELLRHNPIPVSGVSIGPTHLSDELVTRAREHGLLVWAGVTNDRQTIGRLLEWGVDGIISDDLVVLTALRADRVGG